MRLRVSVMEYGLYSAYLQAVPPTGSISYINHSTSSIHPIVAPVEIRKEGKIGRAYYPAPYLSEETLPFYRDAYDLGPEAIIDTYAAATQHVDQGLSLTQRHATRTRSRAGRPSAPHSRSGSASRVSCTISPHTDWV